MWISLVGMDGSGKSTQTRCLRAALSERGIDVHIVDKWNIYDRVQFPECRFVAPPLHDLRICIAEMRGISRAMFLFWAIATTLPESNGGAEKVYLLDGYWEKHAASEVVYGADPKWIQATAALLPKPDLSFYFRIDPELALQRKTDLTPYECGRASDLSRTSFLSHQRAVREVLEREIIHRASDYVTVEGSQPVSRITEYLVSIATEQIARIRGARQRVAG